MIEINNDLLRYQYALKGNYRKGVENLCNILSTEATAMEFCQSPGVAVLFGLQVKDGAYVHDRNSAQLLELLKGSGYYDTALLTFLNLHLGGELMDIATIMVDPAYVDAIAANPVILTALMATPAYMTVIAANLEVMAVLVSDPAYAAAIFTSPVNLNIVLKSAVARAALCSSPYLQSSYDKILATTANITYFKRYTDYVDSGSCNTTTGIAKTAATVGNQSLYLSIKIGSWSNNTSTTGTVCHLQNGASVLSKTTSNGDGKASDVPTTGGVAAQAVCVGGVKFTEVGDSYTRGWFVYAI